MIHKIEIIVDDSCESATVITNNAVATIDVYSTQYDDYELVTELSNYLEGIFKLIWESREKRNAKPN